MIVRMRTKGSIHSRVLWGAILACLVVFASLFVFPQFGASFTWEAPNSSLAVLESEELVIPEVPIVTHIPTPTPVRALYMTSCVAGVPSLRSKIVQMATSTEVNSIIIDIKDYSGAVSFKRENPVFDGKGKLSCDIVPDMQEFVHQLHENNIYVIGRVTVFQDPHYATNHPDLAVQKKDGTVWKDRKGLAFVDVSSKPYWDEIIALAKDSYALGFDEINFDYIRFPSDGNMKDITFPQSGEMPKAEALKNFFAYLHQELLGTGIVTSADLFGMTTSNTDDLGIGQVLENTLPYFDYIAPMVYPSHYPPGFNGYKKPAEMPYEVIKYAMGKGVERAVAASTTPNKLRAWIQDFDLGAVYTADMIRDQKRALYELGLDSWMIWDPSNKYTRAALDPEL